MPFLSRKKDFRAYPSFGTIFQVLNSKRPPLDDVRVRYALNMGTDKRAIADFMGVGRKTRARPCAARHWIRCAGESPREHRWHR